MPVVDVVTRLRQLAGRTGPRRAVIVIVALALVIAAVSVFGTHRAEAAAGAANPSRSITPSPAFATSCYGHKATRPCDRVALKAINSARAGEGLRPVVLPRRYEHWKLTTQLTWITNNERTARRLPAMRQAARLSTRAAAAARAGIDPTGPTGYWWGSNIASGYATPLAADFAWMYDDGPGGANTDCTAHVHSGCWGHRDNIMLASRGESGAAVSIVDGRPEFATLLVARWH